MASQISRQRAGYGTSPPAPRSQSLRVTFQVRHGSLITGTCSAPAAPPPPSSPPPPGPSIAETAVLMKGGRTNSSPARRCSPDAVQCHGQARKVTPDTQSSISPAWKAEKLKTQIVATTIWRSCSLDILTAPYLSGQWPRDLAAHTSLCMADKATQTPSSWMNKLADEKNSNWRSATWDTSEQLKEIAKLRQHLQRSKKSSKRQRHKDRSSPLHGSHTAIHKPQVSICRSNPIPVSGTRHWFKTASPRVTKNSVEGVNQELEHMFICDGGENDCLLRQWDGIDGHQAPLPSQLRSSGTRSVDTQTPLESELVYGRSKLSTRHACNGDRSTNLNTSPSPRITVSECSTGSPGSVEIHKQDDSPLPKYASSPKPNNSYMFKREPPEGCEKVKVFEDIQLKHMGQVPLLCCPDKNKVNFVPKTVSAFCPVSTIKPSLLTVEPSFRAFPGAGGPVVLTTIHGADESGLPFLQSQQTCSITLCLPDTLI
uniref:glucocorticoid-induced transcript 1 protein-like isoform X1 n=1 Tax=Myxine glutinosa TaxID=7769 RepID=UPI00358E121F